MKKNPITLEEIKDSVFLFKDHTIFLTTIGGTQYSAYYLNKYNRIVYLGDYDNVEQITFSRLYSTTTKEESTVNSWFKTYYNERIVTEEEYYLRKVK